MPKALIFDFAGVITKSDAYWDWVNECVGDAEAKKEIFEKLSEDVDSAAISHDEFMNGLSRAAGISREMIWPEVRKRFLLNEELLEMIAELRRQYKTGILSNFTEPWIRELIADFDLAKHFDKILVSSCEKISKPNPRFFERMLNALTVRPDESIFFDDKKRHVEAAKRIGIRAFLFTTNEELKKDLASCGIF